MNSLKELHAELNSLEELHAEWSCLGDFTYNKKFFFCTYIMQKEEGWENTMQIEDIWKNLIQNGEELHAGLGELHAKLMSMGEERRKELRGL